MAENKSDFHKVLIVDDTPSILEDFRSILENKKSVKNQNHSFSELEKKLFSDDIHSEDSKKTLDETPIYDVTYASQGQEAYELVKKSVEEHAHYALIFVDIRMPPGWDGIETIQHIWEIDPWIQIVICTAYSDYSWVDMVKILGNTDNFILLKKPFDVVEVRQLAMALTRKWQLNEDIRVYISDLEWAIQLRTQDLERSLSVIRATLESTADGILVIDRQGKIIDYNKKFSNMWKFLDEKRSPQLLQDVLPAMAKQLVDPENFISKMNLVLGKKVLEWIDELNFKDGKCYELYFQPFHIDKNNFGLVFSFRNITDRKRFQNELLYQATHDKLTNLPNRRLLLDRIKQSIAIAKRANTLLAVMFIDLDKFKLVNDSLGHNAGDLVLKLIAKRFLSVVREADTISRLSGDEFVCVFAGSINEGQILSIAKKLAAKAADRFVLDKHEFFMTASIGISVYPKDGVDPEELLRKADATMYAVKNSGRANIKFSEGDETDHYLEILTMENDLRKALENNEFILHYQPLVDVQTQTIVGAEALIRWVHPKYGILQPIDFLQSAEEMGLIIPIGEWALRTACVQSKKWQDQNSKYIKIAVNVSSTQFKYPKFIENLQAILKETGLNPKYLEFELTESILIENPERLSKVLKDIKKLGISLSVDDFGTGYSSLVYLKNFPFDKLKIDRSFVKDISDNLDDRKIVESIISMANNLKLSVVAEGIENMNQLNILSKTTCDEAQGFLFGYAVSAEEFVKLLNKQSQKTKGD